MSGWQRLLLALLVFIVCGSSYLAAQPDVLWNPKAEEISLIVGTTTTKVVNLRFNAPLTDVSIETTPSIRRFVSIENADKSSAIPAGATGSLVLQISVPVDTLPGAYDGTVHVMSGRRTIASTLKLVLHVFSPEENAVPIGIATPSNDRIVETTEGFFVVGDEVVVSLVQGQQNPDQIALQIARSTNGVVIGSDPNLWAYQIRYTNADVASLEGLLPTITSTPGVDFAVLHYLSLVTRTPNDPLFANGSQWGLNYIGAPGAWDYTIGSSSTSVAIIDRDFDPGHPDLVANVVSPITPAPGRFNTGHGTNVAGIIGAVGNNGIGVTGVGWTAAMRFFDCGLNSGQSMLLDTYCVADSMVMAANSGARVVNLSASSPGATCGTSPLPDSRTLTTAEATAVLWEKAIKLTLSAGKDVFWVFAAGNGCRDAMYESGPLTANAFPNAMAVGSINQTGQLSWFSNYGNNVSVFAPGEQIVSTVPRYCPLNLALLVANCGPNPAWNSLWAPMTGTSQAAPQVSGLAALVRSQHPGFSAAQVRQCIVSASQSSGSPVAGQQSRVINAPEAVICPNGSVLPTVLPATVSYPDGVAVDSSGNVYISDYNGGSPDDPTIYGIPAIIKLSAAGVQTPVPTSGVDSPYGLAVDGYGNVLIADEQHNRIVAIDPQGHQSTLANVTEVQSVATDNRGNVFGVDLFNAALVKIDAQGNPSVIAAPIPSRSIAVDSLGNVYGEDPIQGRLLRWDSQGTPTTLRSNVSGLADLAGVAVDKFGSIYFATTTSVLKLDSSGSLSTVAAAVQPQGIAVDINGNLYVTEPSNSRVLKFKLW